MRFQVRNFEGNIEIGSIYTLQVIGTSRVTMVSSVRDNYLSDERLDDRSSKPYSYVISFLKGHIS